MKKLLIAGALFLACPLAAEMISAVSYNPSRMGDYVYLKVADKANLKGGIEANTMTVRSGGTVSASSPNLNYNVPAVVGASGSTLDMPNTAIHGAAANTYDNYQAVNTGTPNALLNKVYVNGGTTTVKNDSYIATLDAVNRLKQKAATLRANKLSVSGSENASLYEGATTNGFTLAGNDIPQPTATHVNTGSALSDCTLKWEDRITSSNQKVKLLALSGCKGSGSGSGGCTSDPDEVSECEEGLGGTWNYTTCFCNLSLNSGSSSSCSNMKCSPGYRGVTTISGCCCESINCGKTIYGQKQHCYCIQNSLVDPPGNITDKDAQ